LEGLWVDLGEDVVGEGLSVGVLEDLLAEPAGFVHAGLGGVVLFEEGAVSWGVEEDGQDLYVELRVVVYFWVLEGVDAENAFYAYLIVD
jgi:hypothetical protein